MNIHKLSIIATAIGLTMAACTLNNHKAVDVKALTSHGPSMMVIMIVAVPVLALALTFAFFRGSVLSSFSKGLNKAREIGRAGSLTITHLNPRSKSEVEADLVIARAARGRYPEGSDGWNRLNPAVQRLKKELAAIEASTVLRKATVLRTKQVVELELAAARKARGKYSEGSAGWNELNPPVQKLKKELERFRTPEVIKEELAEARARRGKYPENSEGWNRHNPRVQALKKELELRTIAKSAK